MLTAQDDTKIRLPTIGQHYATPLSETTQAANSDITLQLKTLAGKLGRVTVGSNRFGKRKSAW